MSVVVTVLNASKLVDSQLGFAGGADLAGLIGLGGDLQQRVDTAVADRIRTSLGDNGVSADVYTTTSPPAPSAQRSALVGLLVAAAVGYFIARGVK